ncbi:MAG: hypothetical protein H0W53_07285 [Acidobacteria bacterium]|nr:hypothetical protein [Acidobacteriota bacterium]
MAVACGPDHQPTPPLLQLDAGCGHEGDRVLECVRRHCGRERERTTGGIRLEAVCGGESVVDERIEKRVAQVRETRALIVPGEICGLVRWTDVEPYGVPRGGVLPAIWRLHKTIGDPLHLTKLFL